MFDGVGTYVLGDAGTTQYVPTLGDAPATRVVPIDEWLAQEVFIRGDLRLTRKAVILTAANRDGGAHVDPRLTPEYEALAAAGAAGWFIIENNEERIVRPTTDVHLVCIRQFGYEVSNSPELRELGSNGVA
jgi:hypothetical protein